MQESRLFPFMTAQGLISTLDEMVEAKDFSSYGQLRDVIAKRLLACDNGNLSVQAESLILQRMTKMQCYASNMMIILQYAKLLINSDVHPAL